uniref:Uncharacterized protein n=1 Tax=Setaria italica TaxID=4555 RepID=K3Y4J0_SETIT
MEPKQFLKIKNILLATTIWFTQLFHREFLLSSNFGHYLKVVVQPQ